MVQFQVIDFSVINDGSSKIQCHKILWFNAMTCLSVSPQLFKNMALVMAGCWTHDAAARPSAVLVKKRLLRVAVNSGVKIG